MNEKILAFREKEKEKQAEWDRRRRMDELEYERKKDSFEKFKRNNLRNATVKDYEIWLKEWLVENDITHYYNYNYPSNNYIAIRNFVLDVGYYGSQSFNIIVPKGISYEIKELGHCNIYDMNDISCIGHWVPAYDNVNVE